MKVRKLLLQKSGNSDSEGSDIVMPPPKVPTTRRGRKERRTAAAAMAGTPSPACQSAEVAAVQTANARLSEIFGSAGPIQEARDGVGGVAEGQPQVGQGHV